jgi:hypothetical protein
MSDPDMIDKIIAETKALPKLLGQVRDEIAAAWT